MNPAGRVGRNVAGTLARQILIASAGLLTTFLYSRSIGSEGLGIFNLVILLPTLITTVFNMGIAPATVFYVARKDHDIRTSVMGNLIFGTIISLVSMAGSILLVWQLGQDIFPGVDRGYLFIGLSLIPLSLLSQYLISVFQATEDFRKFNLLALVQPLMVLLLVASGFLVFGGMVEVPIFAHIASNALALGAVLVSLRGNISRVDGIRDYLRDCLSFGWKNHLSNILTFLNYRLDLFIVNLIIDPAAVGLYVIAVQISERLWMLSHSSGVVLLPRISALKDDEGSRGRLTPLTSRIVLITTAMGALLLAALSGWLVPLVFGEEFRGSVTPLLILLPGIVIFTVSRTLSNDIAGRGRPEINLFIALITVSVNIIGNVLLTPTMGIEGAALATTLSYSSDAALKVMAYSRLTGIAWASTVIPGKADVATVLKVIKNIVR